MERHKRLRQLHNFFRKELDLPVSYRRIKLPKEKHGEAVLRNQSYLIKIDRRLSETHAIEVLIHEYAHCLAWAKYDSGQGHCHSWGKAYSEIYRLFLEWNRQ